MESVHRLCYSKIYALKKNTDQKKALSVRKVPHCKDANIDVKKLTNKVFPRNQRKTEKRKCQASSNIFKCTNNKVNALLHLPLQHLHHASSVVQTYCNPITENSC